MPDICSIEITQYLTPTSQVLVQEELTILLVSNLRENVFRGICWIGNEFEILHMCRPPDGRTVFDDISDELVLLIAKMHPILFATPDDTEGNFCLYRRTPLQGVNNIVKVPDLYMAESHQGSRIIEVDLYVLIRNAYRPKQAA